MNKSTNKPSFKLTGKNAKEVGVNQAWEQDNQAWWDWYVTLAENIDKSISNFETISEHTEGKLLSVKQLNDELSTPYPLDSRQKELFLMNGFIKLKKMISNNALFTLDYELSKIITDSFSASEMLKSQFLSLDMIWLKSKLIKEFVLSPRIAKVAAELLKVSSVRLYHDNVLSKQPGCGRTPWHYDIHHFPLATQNVITAWIPAQHVPKSMGPLSFAMPIDVYKLVENIPFNKFNNSYDKQVSKIFKEKNIKTESGPFEIGEISFHHNLCFHTAGPNNTTKSRVVLANTYFADGTKVVENPTMVSGDWKKFIPETKPGEIIASPLNPICWPKEGS